jgi:hypothetical protein
MDGYTEAIVEALTIICYRSSAAACQADGVAVEHRQAPG